MLKDPVESSATSRFPIFLSYCFAMSTSSCEISSFTIFTVNPYRMVKGNIYTPTFPEPESDKFFNVLNMHIIDSAHKKTPR